MLLKKIVIAEDDDNIAHLLGATLGDAGFLCLRARDGEEALALCRRDLPDLLVLDVMLPKLDGIEVTRRLKADVLVSRIPILMTTSLAAVEDRIVGLDAGADDYLPKPFDLREVLARVRALIRHSRRERERNPVTNLPGSTALTDHVDARLRRADDFALLWIAVDGLHAYLEAVGFTRADEVLGRIGVLVQDHCQDRPGELFVSHVGGEDFAVALPVAEAEPLCTALLAGFKALLPALPPGPALRLVIVGLDVKRAGVSTTSELARSVVEARRQVPAGTESLYTLASS
ncbi:MAG TPA: response regulator [Polyangia bacterium]|jgi:DNA-binding response OmpR family regulator